LAWHNGPGTSDPCSPTACIRKSHLMKMECRFRHKVEGDGRENIDASESHMMDTLHVNSGCFAHKDASLSNNIGLYCPSIDEAHLQLQQRAHFHSQPPNWGKRQPRYHASEEIWRGKAAPITAHSGPSKASSSLTTLSIFHQSFTPHNIA
jgi:hypothetical protein